MKIIPNYTSKDNTDTSDLFAMTAFGLETYLPKDAMDKLWEYISAEENSPRAEMEFAGNISRSVALTDTNNYFFGKYCIPIIEEHREIYKKSKIYANQMLFRNDIPWTLEAFWVNFQKQHEYNPLHNHQGLYSFVIFMKIPYDWREQHELPFVKHSNTKVAGNFEFVYTNILGKICGSTYKLDPSSEGLMLFFPAEIHHMVYPFYNSEEERITISGNIIYDI